MLPLIYAVCSQSLPKQFLAFHINSEEWSECAIRETLEETGLKIRNISFATVVNAVVTDEDYHYITIFMKGEIDFSHTREPENLEPDKCEGNLKFLVFVLRPMCHWAQKGPMMMMMSLFTF